MSSNLRVTYGQSVHGEAEIDAVVRVLRTSTQMGTHVRTFESQVAALLGKKFGIMVNSGSSALSLAVQVLDLKPGAEVITPVLTFATTVAPIVRAGLVPAFIDVEEATYNIDVGQIEEMVNERTVAVLIPNLIGNVPDWDAIREIADRHNLRVVEDSADTLGATLHGSATGRRSDISTTSFYGSHIINCAGNGGFIGVDAEATARRLLLLRSWGRSSSLFDPSAAESIDTRFDIDLEGIRYDRKFVFEEMGFNYEPSELGAAFGLEQLKRLSANIERRRSNFTFLRSFFSVYEDLFILPRETAGVRTGWLAFPLTVRASAPFSRTEMQMFLEAHNIQTRPVFTGNILKQPAFSRIERRELPHGYPEADKVMLGGLLLGCHHGLFQEHLDYVCSKVTTFIDSRVGR
ncbi:MAG: aminotransferase class I/II-fold pyridoxal phosphate-dependent enzyme [Planctomycetes bacterium]|nr:aminotransferase class I/II-fold pyridoxal phosphate-dependent enzyme [Planctomycetota bacterium]